MRKLLVIVMVVVIAMLAVTPAFAGSCKDFGHAWAEFGQTREAGAVVSSIATSGPNALSEIVHLEMEEIFPCE